MLVDMNEDELFDLIVKISDTYRKKIDKLRGAIRKFLNASGNDLCHENRVELAKAAGLGLAHPELIPRCEFRANCQKYEEDLYGKEN